MLDVGYWLGKQSDPDKTKNHFVLDIWQKQANVMIIPLKTSKLMR